MTVIALLMLSLFSIQPVAEVAGNPVLPVSPGRAQYSTTVNSRCPAFSWATSAQADAYQLAVYEITESGPADLEQPALFETLPGGAFSWTPGRDQCLPAGRRYVWFVRPIRDGAATDWSEGRLFETANGTTRQDVSEALQVVQSYLDDGGSLDDLVRRGADERAARAGTFGGQRARPAHLGRDSENAEGKMEKDSRSLGYPGILLPPTTVPSVGVTATIDEFASAAIRGVNTYSAQKSVAGYLGVRGVTNFEFDGVDLYNQSIGVLGVSLSDADGNNLGVVGVSSGSSFAAAGYFKSVNRTSGAIEGGLVKLATTRHAIDAKASINTVATPKNHVVLIENTSVGTSPDVLALKVGETGLSNIGSSNNFITFFDGLNASMGAIQGNGAGVTLAGPGADFAEYLPKRDALEVIRAADVVGMSFGRVSLSTRGAERVMVVSTAPIVSGNHRWTAKDDEDSPDDHTMVAFIGQTPVRVRGPVREGDYVIASGREDGTAIGVAAEDLSWDQASLLVGRALESSTEPGESTVRTLVGLPETATMAAWGSDLASQVRRLQTQIETLQQSHRRRSRASKRR